MNNDGNDDDLIGEAGEDGISDALIQIGMQNGRNPFVAGGIELIANTIDADATRVDIWVKFGQHLRYIDDGCGLTRDRVARMNSVYRGTKEAKKNVSYNGIGLHNSGRLFNLGAGERMDVYFVSSDFAPVHLLSLGPQQLCTLIKEGRLVNPPKQVEQPNWWPHATGITGTGVEIVNPYWNLFPKNLGEYKRLLAKGLSPWLARPTYVNGVQIPMPYNVKTELELEDVEVPELGGTVRCVLYCDESESLNKRISVGKYPLVSLYDLLNFPGVKQEQWDMLLPSWLWTSLQGFIDAPIVNKYSQPGRTGVKLELIQEHPEAVPALIKYVAQYVVPAAEQQYGLGRHTSVESVNERVMSILTQVMPSDSLGVVEGGRSSRGIKPTTTPPVQPPKPEEPPVVLVPTRTRRRVGENVQVRLRKGESGGEWIVSGGTVIKENRRSVEILLPEEPGKVEVVYRVGDDSGTAVLIAEAEREFQACPGMIDAYLPGSEHTVTIENYTGDKLKWEFVEQPISTGQLPNITRFSGTNQLKVEVKTGVTPGYYKIKITGDAGAEDFVGIKVHAAIGAYLECDGRMYLAKTDDSPTATPVTICSPVSQDGSGAIPTAYINMEAKLLKPHKGQQKGELSPMLVMLLLSCFVNGHLEDVDSQDQQADFARIMEELTTKSGSVFN